MSDRRKLKYGPAIISLGELEKWIFGRTEVPIDEHEVFVISYYIYDAEPIKLRFALSTKYLLKLMCHSTVLHADATYKLIWQGFPVLIAGTTDKNGKFYPVCLAVSTTETTEDFEMLFSGLKNSVLSIYGHSLQPSVLVCDAAKAIQNAFTNVFGSETIIRMCWAHAKKNIITKLEQTVDKKKTNDILEDIDCLQAATSSQNFDVALELFVKKVTYLLNFYLLTFKLRNLLT